MITQKAKETQKLAAGLAKKLIKKNPKKVLVVALEGELGAGKTTFIRGFSKALGVRGKVLSPTFVLIHKHKIANSKRRIADSKRRIADSKRRIADSKRRIANSNFKNLYHIDAFRLKSEKDLLKLGIKEIFANPENIVLIEWADRVKKIIPETATWIRFEHIDRNKRKITTNP